MNWTYGKLSSIFLNLFFQFMYLSLPIQIQNLNFPRRASQPSEVAYEILLLQQITHRCFH